MDINDNESSAPCLCVDMWIIHTLGPHFLRGFCFLSRTAVGLCIKAHGPHRFKSNDYIKSKLWTAWMPEPLSILKVKMLLTVLVCQVNRCNQDVWNLLPKNCDEKHFINQNNSGTTIKTQSNIQKKNRAYKSVPSATVFGTFKTFACYVNSQRGSVAGVKMVGKYVHLFSHCQATSLQLPQLCLSWSSLQREGGLWLCMNISWWDEK